ncbi:MAG: sigma-70 family RNA polymerase sigma factor [Solirubrobacteraceae bacterium]
MLYRDEWKQLVRLAALLLGDVAAGEDVVQEAFLRLAGRDRGWDGTVRLSYLRTTVINLSRSALRRRRVAARHSAQEARPIEAAELEAARAFERSAIVAALGRLPRRQREVLALRYYADLPLGDIAE